MIKIKLLNPENAIRIIKERDLTSKSDNVTVINNGVEKLIFDSEYFNVESFGTSLKIGFDGGGVVGIRYSYLTLSLEQYISDINIELIELQYGIALKINNDIVYYKICFKTIDEILHLTELKALDLTGWDDLESLDVISNFNKIESIKLTIKSEYDSEESSFDFQSLLNFKKLSCLHLACNYSEDLFTMSLLNQIDTLFIEFYNGWGEDENYSENTFNMGFISGMSNLRKLEFYKFRRISDLSFLDSLLKLEILKLDSPYALEEINLNSRLVWLNELVINVPINIKSFDFLSMMPNIKKLEIIGCDNINEINSIGSLENLNYLNLNGLSNIISLQSISTCRNLETLNLGSLKLKNIDIDFSNLKKLNHLDINSSKVRTLGNLCQASELKTLDISDCENLTKLNSIEKLTNLTNINAVYSFNIRDLQKLSICKSLLNLNLDDKVLSYQILMSTAFLRSDKQYIILNIKNWIKKINLSSDAVIFITRLLNCIGILEKDERKQYLISACYAMRARGIESELLNDLDTYTWENWCNLSLDLEKADLISCLQAAVNDLDIERETEVILGPVIIAFSELIERYTAEKEAILSWVQEQLQRLVNHPEEQRQIAPSAAVFFASLNMKDDVLFWLQKATDEKAPLWRDNVLSSLIKHYAGKEKFSEAQTLLEEMQLQDEKDMAISSIAQAMATKHPIDAGFLLDDIQNTEISAEAARKLLQQPAMLQEPQGLYQLILHLQANPEELARTLEFIIANDTEGKLSALLKQLFIQIKPSGPSAAVFLELCKHPVSGQFVKAWKLEELIRELNESFKNEQKEYIPQFIDLLESRNLIDAEEKVIMSEKINI